MAAEASDNETEKKNGGGGDGMIIIYVVPGSQFSFKVLAALEARKIPHFVEFVPTPPEERRKILPSGGTMVPEMKATNPEAVVPDSEAILHWLDDHRATNFFPSDSQASELSLRASTKTLAGLVWYYNWINKDGYKASMQKSLGVMILPSWLGFGREWIVDCAVDFGKFREKHAKLVMEALGITDEKTLQDEDYMNQLLMEELQFFQSLLESEEQPYLLAGNEPTAVDFSVFAQLQRFVGAGEASDVSVYPALPELKNNAEFARLWKWYDMMCEKYPVKFKGKRIPK